VLIDREFCEELLNGRRAALLAEFDMTNEERRAVLSIKIDSETRSSTSEALQVARRLVGLCPPVTPSPGEEMERGYLNKLSMDARLVESLAWGLLRAYGVTAPPVPVREMIERPLPVFEQLKLLELSLGLYDAAYRSGLNGSRMIVVDPMTSRIVQRVSMARELYVAFCRSSRAAELDWPHRNQPHAYSDFFAHCLLMPTAWVQEACAEAVSLETLAAHFDVPVQTVTQRLSEVNQHHPCPGLRESLTETLFSLKEPWQGRFLSYVFHRATSETMWNRQPPTREDVTNWLGENPGLCQDMRYMLHAWLPGQNPAL